MFKLTITAKPNPKSQKKGTRTKKLEITNQTDNLKPFQNSEIANSPKQRRKHARNKLIKNYRARKIYAGKKEKVSRCETQNLEKCVDGCTEVEDILEYSRCVVQCSKKC